MPSVAVHHSVPMALGGHMFKNQCHHGWLLTTVFPTAVVFSVICAGMGMWHVPIGKLPYQPWPITHRHAVAIALAVAHKDDCRRDLIMAKTVNILPWV